MSSVSSSDSQLRTGPPTIEVIWQMALSSLPFSNNELLLTRYMMAQLNQNEITELKSRLCNHLNISSISIVFEPGRQLFRFVKDGVTADHTLEAAAAMSPSHLSTSPSSLSEEMLPSWKVRAQGKKSKVPRPPNSFILYRQKWHPILKKENPEMHNNDISVIIGKKWKAESAAVQDEFKKLADEKKKQHEMAYPSYQYMPRKTSEKKRRMTNKKRMQLLEIGESSRAQVHEMSGFPDTGSYTSGNALSTQASFNLPEANQELQWDLGMHNSQLPATNLPFHPPNRTQVETSTAAQVQDDQDLFDSIVDWNAIAADFEMITNMVDAERAEFEAIEPGLTAAESAAKKLAEFEAELERTLDLFE